jgi:hypothetical protein
METVVIVLVDSIQGGPRSLGLLPAARVAKLGRRLSGSELAARSERNPRPQSRSAMTKAAPHHDAALLASLYNRRMWSSGSERRDGLDGVADGLFTNAAGALSLRRNGQGQHESSGEQNSLHGYLLISVTDVRV